MSNRSRSKTKGRRAWLTLPAGLPFAVPVVLILATVMLAATARSSDPARRHLVVDPNRAQVDHLPAWVSKAVLRDVHAELRELGTFDLGGDGVEEAVKERILRDCAWVKGVDRVTKQYPNSTQIVLDLRRPVARAKFGGREIAFDAEGVALPTSALDLDAPNGRPLPLVTGGRLGAAPPQGQRVPWAEYLEGISVAADLAEHQLGSARAPLLVEEIDITHVPRPGSRSAAHRDGLPEISLVVHAGRDPVQIRWGRSRRSPRPAAFELSVDDKIARLHFAMRKYPGLKGIAWVDVWREELAVGPGVYVR